MMFLHRCGNRPAYRVHRIQSRQKPPTNSESQQMNVSNFLCSASRMIKAKTDKKPFVVFLNPLEAEESRNRNG